MKKIILFTSFVILVACNKETKIISSLDAVIIEGLQVDTVVFCHDGKIVSSMPIGRKRIALQQTFDVFNYMNDTLCFYMGKTNNSYASTLVDWVHCDHSQPYDEEMADFAQNFKLTIDNIDYSKDCIYENNALKICIPRAKRHKVNIKYYYDNFLNNFRWSIEQFYCRNDFRYNSEFLEQWYFTTDSMQWKKVKIHAPNDSIEIITNYPHIQKDSIYVLDFNNAKKEDGIWFSAVEKNMYDKRTLSTPKYTINYYAQRYFEIDSTTNKVTNIRSERVEKGELALKQTDTILNKLYTFFRDTTYRTFNVFKQHTHGGGSTLLSTNQNYLLMMDSAWFDATSYKDYIHEYIHCFLSYPHDSDTVCSYFFVESMTIFLDYYITFGDTKILSEEIAKKYNILPDEIKNMPILGTDRYKKSDVFYCKGPYMLYLFAQRVGVDKLVDIIIDYYGTLRANGTRVTMGNFEQFLKDNGVSDEDWNYFMQLLSVQSK